MGGNQTSMDIQLDIRIKKCDYLKGPRHALSGSQPRSSSSEKSESGVEPRLAMEGAGESWYRSLKLSRDVRGLYSL